MRIPRIYTAQTLDAEADFQLEAGPAAHVARVLRMATGDALLLFDGRGGEYPATITGLDRHAVSVRTQQRRQGLAESPLHIHLGIAVSRGERMDWVVQKATELGVAAVSPLLSERTGVKLNAPRAEKKRRHWQQVAISACEQCGRCDLPEIHPLAPLPAWLDSVDAPCRLLLQPGANAAAPGASPRRVALLIGPEGGFSQGEVELAQAAGFRGLQLGPRILRTETAPLAAIAVLQARWGDLA
ncbi:MAG: 16S rRNA (uracil(1498)-N(3))-methyltransferase [Halioglobus sp.]|nr:16S rRNA (uracil(1498)-N(3))-methyltransferase [Halioglobus sp.]